MKQLSEIKFKVNESPIKGHGGITCYQGQVIHNRTFNVDETRKYFVESIGLGKELLANFYLDSLTTYIAEEIAKGNRLDFGPFSVGLKMRGSLPVWIENDDGVRLATGAVYDSSACKCDFMLDEHIDPGTYWLVISARYKSNPQLLRSKRRVTVIANP